jgi:hypothetical protein
MVEFKESQDVLTKSIIHVISMHLLLVLSKAFVWLDKHVFRGNDAPFTSEFCR